MQSTPSEPQVDDAAALQGSPVQQAPDLLAPALEGEETSQQTAVFPTPSPEAEEASEQTANLVASVGTMVRSVLTEGNVDQQVTQAAKNAKEEFDTFIDSTNEGDLEAQVAKVLDGAESIVTKFLSLASKPAEDVNIQQLQLDNCTEAEKKFATYSALGRVVVGLACQGIAAMPFGAPVAALLGE